MAEPVRASATRAMAEEKVKAKRPKVGLARVPPGVQFRCGECEYYEKGVGKGKCGNEDPEVYNKEVHPVRECCDLYDHEGMERLTE